MSFQWPSRGCAFVVTTRSLFISQGSGAKVRQVLYEFLTRDVDGRFLAAVMLRLERTAAVIAEGKR